MPRPPARAANGRQPGFVDRLAGADLFQQLLVGFILFYAVLSLGLEHVAGIIGFAKIPYINAGTYLYALSVAALALLTSRAGRSVFAIHPFALAILASLGIAVTFGIANGNATTYIAGWTLYIATAVIMFSVFRTLPARETPADPVALVFSRPVLAVVLVTAVLSVFSKDNHYQYVLTEVIGLSAMLLRPSVVDKALGAAIFALVHLGSNEGFVQVEINRASILSVAAVGMIWLIYRRHLVVSLFIVIAAAGGLAYALSLDDDTIETLPRNIKEAIFLMKGDDIYNHVSSYQRVYEGQMVMADFADAPPSEILFGKGLGRTIDMSGAADRTVGQHALLGVLEVHNIHFIHYAILHKFGAAGLVLFGLLVATILWRLGVDLATRRMDDGLMILYVYVIYNLVFALPASNHLIGNPLWAAFVGTLFRQRLAPRHQP